ncbi:MAG: GNAT family N-acetyltransferase [Thermoanaerobaculia bacterium]
MSSGDIPGIIELCQRVYPHSAPWTAEQLTSHLRVFPEGQLVAVDDATDRIVGMAASLIVYWDDYDLMASWRDFTDHGLFTNHDPGRGRTLYGAEVMVDPDLRGRGIGSALYAERRRLTVRLGLLRIRAGARLRGYGKHASSMSAEEYVRKVEAGEIHDPTLSFQLARGFSALAVVPSYLKNDPESLGYAVVIEWLNPKVAHPASPEPPR